VRAPILRIPALLAAAALAAALTGMAPARGAAAPVPRHHAFSIPGLLPRPGAGSLPQPGAQGPINYYILAGISAVSSTDAWAAGYFGHRTLLVHWDGSTWTQVPSPNPGGPGENSFYGVSADSPTDAWAVGLSEKFQSPAGTLIAHWNGTSWTQVPSPEPGRLSWLFAVSAVSPADAWAVGYFSSKAGADRTLIEHWNGTAWTKVPSPTKGADYTYLTSVSAISATDAWAVGYYYTPGTNARTLTEHWNGTAWSIVPSPVPGQQNMLNGVTAVSATDAWAVGFLYPPGHSATPNSLILHWDGSTWTQVPAPDPGGADGTYLMAVTALCGTDVWAAGSFSSENRTLTLRWDGTTWKQVKSPNLTGPSENYLTSISAVSGSVAWAAGAYHDLSRGALSPLVLRWDGTKWTPVLSSPPAMPGG
jgi:hypothetical protein